MARTRRAAAADPKRDTTDSRKQLKNTRSVREGRTGPLRAKRPRAKKSGRLDTVDHEHVDVARSVRPRVALDAPRAVEVVEEPAPAKSDPASDANEAADRGFSLRAVARDVKETAEANALEKNEKSQHNTPPRRHAARRAVSPAASPAVPPLVPRAVAPRAAAAVAAASAAGVASPVAAPVIKVRAADFNGASEFRAPPAW
jgi:hypothetical protein